MNYLVSKILKFCFTIFNILLVTVSFSQAPFSPLDTNYKGSKLIVPFDLMLNVLISQGDVIQDLNGEKFIENKMLCSPLFITDSISPTNTGFIFVPRESNKDDHFYSKETSFTFFRIKKWGDVWQPSGKYIQLNFTSSGNIDGSFLSKNYQNKLYFSEKRSIIVPYVKSKSQLLKKKSTPKDSIILEEDKWISQIDPYNPNDKKSIYSMGSFNSGSILFLSDSITVFLTNRDTPSALLKYIAYKKNDFNNGQLYAYKQSSNGVSGFWIPLPMVKDSLKSINKIALNEGATFFMGLEGMCQNNNKIYIAETGKENFHASLKTCLNSVSALHNNIFKKNEEVYDNPFGAILEFDINSDKIYPIIYGGNNEDLKIFSNPTSISFAKFDNNDFLLINEDIQGPGKGRAPLQLYKSAKVVNETWLLDISTPFPNFTNLHRLFIVPDGFKILGGNFDLNYKSYFFSIHPTKKNSSNAASATYVVSGFKEKLIREKRLKN